MIFKRGPTISSGFGYHSVCGLFVAKNHFLPLEGYSIPSRLFIRLSSYTRTQLCILFLSHMYEKSNIIPENTIGKILDKNIFLVVQYGDNIYFILIYNPTIKRTHSQRHRMIKHTLPSHSSFGDNLAVSKDLTAN